MVKLKAVYVFLLIREQVFRQYSQSITYLQLMIGSIFILVLVILYVTLLPDDPRSY